MGLAKYFKSAFLHHWNLLALVGATGFAVLSADHAGAVAAGCRGGGRYLGMLRHASQSTSVTSMPKLPRLPQSTAR